MLSYRDLIENDSKVELDASKSTFEDCIFYILFCSVWSLLLSLIPIAVCQS